MSTGGKLVAVLSNPPLSTDGLRTLARVDQARSILGYSTVDSVNLFSVPTYRTGEISRVGQTPEGWLVARPSISLALSDAAGVLLAYGCQEPSGAARKHHRTQLIWLRDVISKHRLPAWCVGSRTLHPSRWQRHTYANHPDLPFSEALAASMHRYDAFD